MATETKKGPTREEVAAWVEKATKEALAGVTPEHVERVVSKMIAQATNDMVAKAMGMSHAWNRWEVDRCNGREPMVAKMIQEHAVATVAAWAKSIGEVTLNKSEMKQVRTAYRTELKECAIREARRLGEEHAIALVGELPRSSVSGW